MLTLLYHNIVSARVACVPVASAQVTASTFRKHLARFRGQLLDPFDVHEQIVNGKRPRGVLITFDDGAAGIVEAGRLLAEVGARGVAFVCPGALTSGLWFYRLADALISTTVSTIRWQDSSLETTTGTDKLRAYKVMSRVLFDFAPVERDLRLEHIIGDLRVSGEPTLSCLTTLNEASIQEAKQTGGLVFANHSWSHPNLTTLSPKELSHEIEHAQSWLASSGLPMVPWFAFPRGSHNRHVRTEVARCCPVVFGADAFEREANGVWPRTYLCDLDSNPLRLAAKTVWEGRLRRTLSI